MKKQIRRGIFETNSSSEHSITIIPYSDFLKWKNGELLASIEDKSDSDYTWGNFWSRLITFKFTDDFEKAKKENELKYKSYIRENIEELENYKNRCLSYKKLVERELTEEELSKLTREEEDEYQNNLYLDEINTFDKVAYEEEKRQFENLTYENFVIFNGSYSKGIWMTYEEFRKGFIEKGDCYSPFEFDCLDSGVKIIGKYYHS